MQRFLEDVRLLYPKTNCPALTPNRQQAMQDHIVNQMYHLDSDTDIQSEYADSDGSSILDFDDFGVIPN